MRFLLTVFTMLLVSAAYFASGSFMQQKSENHSSYPIERSEEEWKKRLSPKEFHVLREGGTERAFTGVYWDQKDAGRYHCKACLAPLFDSGTKYASGSGWPSFYQALQAEAVEKKVDRSLGMVRTEALCARCGSHLGHIFEDGPQPTGLRFCINSAALKFEPEHPQNPTHHPDTPSLQE